MCKLVKIIFVPCLNVNIKIFNKQTMMLLFVRKNLINFLIKDSCAEFFVPDWNEICS